MRFQHQKWKMQVLIIILTFNFYNVGKLHYLCGAVRET